MFSQQKLQAFCWSVIVLHLGATLSGASVTLPQKVYAFFILLLVGGHWKVLTCGLQLCNVYTRFRQSLASCSADETCGQMYVTHVICIHVMHIMWGTCNNHNFTDLWIYKRYSHTSFMCLKVSSVWKRGLALCHNMFWLELIRLVKMYKCIKN
jgi:hypothetical protein